MTDDLPMYIALGIGLVLDERSLNVNVNHDSEEGR
jgi:hypothetical protein